MPITFARQMLLFFVLCPLIAAGAGSHVEGTYSGTLHNERLNLDQLVRLSIHNYPAAGANGMPVDHYAASFNLFLSSFSGKERAGVLYNPVSYNPSTHEFLLQKADLPKGRRVPTLRLQWDGKDQISGDFYSVAEGYVGTIQLGRGLGDQLSPSTQLLQSIAGTYKANCANQISGSGAIAHRIIIYPSRFFLANQMAADSTLLSTNYVGSIVANFEGEPRVYSDFVSGTYNFYSNQLTLFQGGTQWKCTPNGDEMACDSPDFPACSLKRISKLEPTDAVPFPSSIEPIDMAAIRATHLRSPSKAACGNWDGNYLGVLTHRLDGSKQYIKIQIFTYLSQDGAVPKCNLSGNVALIFGDDPNQHEKVITTLPEIEFVPGQMAQTLLADKDADGTFEISRKADGSIDGNYYSKFIGFVGTFTAANHGPAPALGPKFVPAVAGHYQLDYNPNQELHLQTGALWPNPESYDPFSQVGIAGWRQLFLSDGQVLGIESIRTDAIDMGAYDYFTHSLVLRTVNVLLAGNTSEDRFCPQIMGRVYNTPPASTSDVVCYVRMPGN